MKKIAFIIIYTLMVKSRVFSQTIRPGTGTSAAPGGFVGKAIGGGSGNSIININAGQSFGGVD